MNRNAEVDSINARHIAVLSSHCFGSLMIAFEFLGRASQFDVPPRGGIAFVAGVALLAFSFWIANYPKPRLSAFLASTLLWGALIAVPSALGSVLRNGAAASAGIAAVGALYLVGAIAVWPHVKRCDRSQENRVSGRGHS